MTDETAPANVTENKRPREDVEEGGPAKRAREEASSTATAATVPEVTPAKDAAASAPASVEATITAEEAAENDSGAGAAGDKKGSGRGRGQGRGRQRGGRFGDNGRGRKEYKGKDRRARGAVNEEDAMNADSGKSTPTPATPAKGAEGAAEGSTDGTKRLPKKRAAVLVGYCGTGYHGMQIQTHGSITIEGEIFAALAKAGAVSPENAVDHKKVDVQRAARTDAGVHAAGNCISLKMILDPPVPPEFPDLTAYVNSFLPEQIRMWGFVRTMKSFQARTACDSRVYEYLLPSYCLLPPASADPFAKTLDVTSPGWRDVVGSALEFVDAAPPIPDLAPGEEFDPRARGEFERRRGWRVDPDTLERFRQLVGMYHGTHNFHNYTVYKSFDDRSVKRYMIKLDVRDPAVYGDIEWISVRIHGQSFMLHQIRKMISMAMLACRTGTPPSLIPETFGPKRIHIPKAPPLGLLLEQPQFKTYNERARSIPTVGDEKREYVDFGKYEKQMHDFKVAWIYEKLREVELETNTYHKWLKQIDCSASDQFTFLNTKGAIPDAALVNLTSKKYGGPGGQPRPGRNPRSRNEEAEEAAANAAVPADGEADAEGDDVDDSDAEDAELDQRALASGEFDS